MRSRMLKDDHVHVKHYVVRGLALESCAVVPALAVLLLGVTWLGQRETVAHVQGLRRV